MEEADTSLTGLSHIVKPTAIVMINLPWNGELELPMHKKAYIRSRIVFGTKCFARSMTSSFTEQLNRRNSFEPFV